MINLKSLEDRIFTINSEDDFNEVSLEVFLFQYQHNEVYRAYLQQLNIDVHNILHWTQIPFLPIDFFKTHKVTSFTENEISFFQSSGTTGKNTSKHFIKSFDIYERSFLKAFNDCWGNIQNYTFLALLPNYLEQQHSSLIYMVQKLIEQTQKPCSGFYQKVDGSFVEMLNNLNHANEPIILFGVTYSLLDLIELQNFKLKNTIVFETGGMKGRRKEIIREELHQILCKGLGVSQIASEYGMTELFSQAYSKANGIYATPPWMKIRIREANDPFNYLPANKTGGISVIDLANLYSCSFIATQDLGQLFEDDTFVVKGRFDNSDIRGCNLLAD